MSSKEKAAESDGESPSIARALKRVGEWPWRRIASGFFPALLQVSLWSLLLFIDKRPTALADAQYVFMAVGITGLLTQLTIFSASAARSRDRAYWSVIIIVAYTFLVIIVDFAALYWIMGTTANFNPDLSRIDAVYFALGTLTTAGTGSVVPTSQLARGVVSGQMFVDFVFVAAAVTIAITRWSERSSPTGSPD